jgi:signal transduction histidine kinase/ActR/RegA family two-component response regulator
MTDPRALSLAERERAVAELEKALRLREDALRLREQVTRDSGDLITEGEAAIKLVMLQLREVNERLVVTTVRAQTAVDQAEQANHLKDEFLAAVSHELRTPLTAVLGWARMLRGKELPLDRTSHAIRTIERNALSLAHIIDDLLDVSSASTGALRLVADPVDVKALVRLVVESLRPLAAARGVDIAFLHDPFSAGVVTGDSGRLQQVFRNLVENAIKFNVGSGRIDVFVGLGGDQVEVKVVDTGQGIGPDFLPHVFGRFRQADGTPSRRYNGLGLGLAIVQQLVELHGGTVWAESDGPGSGATFTVRLPMCPVAQPIASAQGLRVRTIPRLDNVRILIVEDDADARELTALILTNAGATVKTAASAWDAQRELAAERPDVVVSDVGLPGEDGYSLVRKIREQEAEQGGFLPAIALTGFAGPADRALAMESGFQTHLCKPIEASALVAAIAAVARPASDVP